MSSVVLEHHFPTSSRDADELLSWTRIAAAVRSRACTLSAEEAQDLSRFADLLDGFADLEKSARR